MTRAQILSSVSWCAPRRRRRRTLLVIALIEGAFCLTAGAVLLVASLAAVLQ